MSAITHSLLATLSLPDGETGPPTAALVPVEGPTAFHALAECILTQMVSTQAQPGTLFLDGQTAHALAPEVPLSAAGWELHIFSDELPAWCANLHAHAHLPVDTLHAEDRFCIAAAPGRQAAVVAEEHDESLQGVWTTARKSVETLGATLAAAAPNASQWPPPAEQAAPEGESLTLALARRHATLRAPAPRPSGHDDLNSVLEILKAISAERRSSDILYVFAEGVAKVVPMERCSVLRVWGGQRHGQVLASHEDERVQDLSIDLALYPEVREVLRTGHKVVIGQVSASPLMRPVRTQLDAAGITSIVVVPIVTDDPEVGTLLLRAARQQGTFDTQEVGFFEIVTQAASNALERANLLENLQLANEHLERLAVTDGLTGLHNHRYFIERLDEEVQRAKRYDTPLACIFVDIDNFKEFNDTYGHLVGDSVLREASQRIAQVMRRVDTVARYGGEELTIILPQTDAEGAALKGEMIRALIAGMPFANGGGSVPVTVSVGVAVYCPETMEDHLALCRAADRALYISKRNGKNCVTVGGSHS